MNVIIKLLLFTLFSILSLTTQGQNVQLLDVHTGECTHDDYSRMFDRIAAIRHRGDTAFVTINFLDNCGLDSHVGLLKHHFLYQNDSIFIDYQRGLSEVMCICCYSYTYIIHNYNHKLHTVLFRGRPLPFTKQKYYETVETAINDTVTIIQDLAANNPTTETIVTPTTITIRRYDGCMLISEHLRPRRKD